MLTMLKRFMEGRGNPAQAAGPERILSRKLARELSSDEIQKIAGGCCATTVTNNNDNCDCNC